MSKPRTRKPKGPSLLADAIATAGLRKGEAADRCGLRPVDMSRFLNARRVPTIVQAAALADHFGIPMRSWLK